MQALVDQGVGCLVVFVDVDLPVPGVIPIRQIPAVSDERGRNPAPADFRKDLAD
jgi:hypothetical protein